MLAVGKQAKRVQHIGITAILGQSGLLLNPSP